MRAAGCAPQLHELWFTNILLGSSFDLAGTHPTAQVMLSASFLESELVETQNSGFQ
jgi:hypothetical protein